MHLLRLDTLRRLIAATLVAALGLSLVPAAGAHGGPPSLSAMLDDVDAFESALAAARAAEPGADPISVFAETYAAAVDGVSADVLAHLLGRASLSGILPPAHDEALATAKVQVPPTTSAAMPLAISEASVAPTAEMRLRAEGETPTLRVQAPSTRPRAP